ncbi:MAG: phospho-sugar mutase [Bacillota bacterium]|nr:phospho-sugar mutase [Bacillota bacterium]
MTYKENLKKWQDKNDLEPVLKVELEELSGKEDELKSRFGSILEFGTAGLRGTMGVGPNRMNIYTVRYATQGLANFISSKGDDAKKAGVVIACDSRNNSDLFSKEAARVLAATGIKVYLFESLRPTPELSFAVRYLHCTAGINITASHNPKEYNGYKAYWSDGAQLAPELANEVMSAIVSIDIFDDVHLIDIDDGIKSGIISIIGKEIDDEFIKAVLSQSVSGSFVKEFGKNLGIVYTPFHGAGYHLVPEVLSKAGFSNVTTVPEQMVLDGNFPTVKNPNPSDIRGFALAKDLAEKCGAQLIIGTDPDADRVVGLAKNNSGKFEPFTGNQMGVLLLNYIIEAGRENGTLPKNPALIKSIVSTYMVDAICEKNGVSVFNVLTGFKYIGELANKFYETGSHSFILGFEESCGYLTGNYARDKDAVLGALLISEMALYYKQKGLTLWDVLNRLYKEYGCFVEYTLDASVSGLDAADKIKNIVSSLRENIPSAISGVNVSEVTDLLTSETKNKLTGKVSKSDLPVSNVIIIRLSDNSNIIIRPSGTEPKVKLYFFVKSETIEDANKKISEYQADMKTIMGL